MEREHKGKLGLDQLLIKPVQKIPRYELLIQRLLKHTDTTHPDFELLQAAQKEVHELVVKINCTERESLEWEQQQSTLREVQALVEGLAGIVTNDRWTYFLLWSTFIYDQTHFGGKLSEPETNCLIKLLILRRLRS